MVVLGSLKLMRKRLPDEPRLLQLLENAVKARGGLGFFGGGFISPVVSGGRPIQVRAVPPGTPRWGSAWKDATARWYNHSFPITTHGINYAHRNHYLDLDPTYRDAIGRPLVRMT